MSLASQFDDDDMEAEDDHDEIGFSDVHNIEDFDDITDILNDDEAELGQFMERRGSGRCYMPARRLFE